MSYLVFARKYRPQEFDEIVGQDIVTKSLKNAVLSDRIAHAYIFSGPRGVGKTSSARILAKVLNCQDGPTINPCGKCPACVEITQGRSLDVIEIDGASNRGIEDIRNLRENVKFGSTSGKYKVYIIDEVHQITPDGFNALLKTLEEPPAHVIFIFATTAIHKVPPTILSRCQRFEFRPITIIKIVETLEQLVKKENLKIENNVLSAIARASEGSLRDAESLLDQLSSFGQGEISVADVTSLLGIIEDELLVSLVDKIIKKDADGALLIVDNFINQGKDASVFVASLTEYFRNLMLAKVSEKQLDKLLNTTSHTKEEVFKQAKLISLPEILRSIDTLANTQEMFRRIDSPRIALEIAIVSMLGIVKDNLSPEKLPQNNNPQLSNLAANIKTQPPPSIKKTEDNAAQEALVSFERVLEIWQSVIDKISKAKMSLATYLNEGSPLKIEKNILFISFPKKLKFHKDVLEKRDNSEFIEQNLGAILGVRIKLNFILSDERPNTQEADIEPNIRSTIAAFKGKIINRGH